MLIIRCDGFDPHALQPLHHTGHNHLSRVPEAQLAMVAITPTVHLASCTQRRRVAPATRYLRATTTWQASHNSWLQLVQLTRQRRQHSRGPPGFEDSTETTLDEKKRKALSSVNQPTHGHSRIVPCHRDLADHAPRHPKCKAGHHLRYKTGSGDANVRHHTHVTVTTPCNFSGHLPATAAV